MIFIILFSVLVLFVINIFYRLLINQNEVLEIKDRIKSLESESKKYKDNPEKQKEHFSKVMEENRKLTKLSFKPMLVSFMVILVMLPVISIFYADFSIDPANQQNLTIDNYYEYNLTNKTLFLYSANAPSVTCDIPCFKQIDGKYFSITEENIEGKERVRLSRVVAQSPVAIPYIGKNLGWIWFYILLSIPLSIMMKKLLGVKI